MNTRREFLKRMGVGAAALAAPGIVKSAEPKRAKLNILLFTADDLACDSVGCFGGRLPGLTPNMDRFATEGLRFQRAHVTAAICVPSRGALATGRYGHNSGVMGFMKTDRDIPTVMETMRDAGYLTGILGKVGHSTPKASYKWDFAHDQAELGAGRDPEIYYRYCKEFFEKCRNENKPFYFMVNSHDPHRPFHVPGKPIRNAAEPSRTYTPDDVPVFGYLPDLPGVRQELSYYLNSVRRCDDTFGRTMTALKESGFEDNTLVMFLSDNGVAVPFAKCNAYLASTRTPWIARWPGVVKPGSVNADDFISGIDFFPTVLDALGLPIPEGLDGASFVPLLKGQKQSGRDKVFTQIDSKAGGAAVPMRCVQNARFGYIFNGWSNGTRYYRNNNEGMTMKAMVEAAATDPAVAERVKMFRYRAQEEFYDLQKDPDCLRNLVDYTEYQAQLNQMRAQMQDWMKQSGDPVLEAFMNRQSPEKCEAALRKVYGENLDKGGKRKKARSGGTAKRRKKDAKQQKRRNQK